MEGVVSERDRVLAECLRDANRRRDAGETIDLDHFAERLGDDLDEFKSLLDTERLLEDPAPGVNESPLPRPFGPYTLLGELGRGAVGVVYEALHRELGRLVALKVLRTAFDAESDAKTRFKTEARAVARLRHPNIVEIYDHGEVDGHLYYAMNLIEGRNLSVTVKMDGPMPVTEAAEGAAEIADALAELHEAGVIHRDIKPQNIMIDLKGRWVLADFGLARMVDSQTLTRSRDALGTPRYMSPEQILGRREAVDGRSDLYGLGATLYQSLAGRPPFATDDMQVLMRMVLHDRCEPPSKHRPELPRTVDHVLLKCLEKERKDRYPSARELATDLRALAQGESPKGRPLSLGVRAARSARRHWLRYLAAAAVVIVPLLVAWSIIDLPTTIKVDTIRGARISVDGGTPASADVAQQVEPGEHEVRVSHDLFVTAHRNVVVEARARRHEPIELDPVDPYDPTAQLLLAEYRGGDLGILSDEEMAPGTTRGGAKDDPWTGRTVVLVYPRGDVSPRDLTELRVDLPPKKRTEGHLVWRVGEREVHREPFPLESDFAWQPTQRTIARRRWPQAIRGVVDPGGTLTWSFEPIDPSTGPPATQAVTLQTASRILQVTHSKEVVRDQLRARALMADGRNTGAWMTLQRALRRHDNEPLRKLARAALRRLFGQDREALHASHAWRAVAAQGEMPDPEGWGS